MFRQGTGYLVDELIVPEKKQGGNTPDPVVGRCHLAAARVELGNDDPAEKSFCHGINGWRQHPAGAAGGGEKIHHDGLRGLPDKGGKAGIVQFNGYGNTGQEDGSFASAAFGAEMLFVGRDSVFCAAMIAGNNNAVHGKPHLK